MPREAVANAGKPHTNRTPAYRNPTELPSTPRIPVTPTAPNQRTAMASHTRFQERYRATRRCHSAATLSTCTACAAFMSPNVPGDRRALVGPCKARWSCARPRGLRCYVASLPEEACVLVSLHHG
jgi:hypothetical protein